MQDIRVVEVRGPLGKGDKKFFAVKDDKGAEFTTFDTKINQVTPGSLISAEIKIDGKYNNITEWKLLEQGALVSAQVNGRSDMTPELWAEKDRLERRSREAIACFQGIMELAASEQHRALRSLNDVLKERLDKTLDAALDWALAHFTLPQKTSELAEVEKQAKKKESDKAWDAMNPEFKDRGEFLTRVTVELKLTTAEICVKLSINDVKEITDFKKAWAILTQKPATEKES